MMTTWLVVAAIGMSAAQPALPPAAAQVVEELPPYEVPGPMVKLPCRVPTGTPEPIGLQLWVSGDRGKTWALADEITADKAEVEFRANKPGQYWFAARVKYKNGRFSPEDARELSPCQSVFVITGYEPDPAPKANRLANAIDELDEELTRLELDLIRKEIKRLAEAKGFDLETADKIDRLRMRLQETRSRLHPSRDPLIFPPVGERPLLVPSVSPGIIPSVVAPSLPAIPPATPPGAPPPRVPGRPS